jgi:hypothetical protein
MGWHYTPCRGGGGRGRITAGGVLALVVLVVVVAKRRAIETGLTDLLELALAVMGGLVAIGITVAVVVWRVRRRRALADRMVLTAVPVRPGLPGQTARAVPRASMPALPRANASTQPRINAPAPVVTGRAVRPRCTQRRPDRR